MTHPARSYAVDVDFLLRQANLASQQAEERAQTLKARLTAQKLTEATRNLRRLAQELAEEMR